MPNLDVFVELKLDKNYVFFFFKKRAAANVLITVRFFCPS